MNPIGIDPIMAFDDKTDHIINCDRVGLPLAARPGLRVVSYRDLLRKIAELQYHNPRFTLLFRGQPHDYKSIYNNKETSHSSLFPSLLRGSQGRKKIDLLRERFAKLKKAEDLLADKIRNTEVLRHQIVRWAVLQHYEVCSTPFLDVSFSLQTALSFSVDAENNAGYLYVLAIPQAAGPISTSLESLTQIVDLQKLCPPEALRPHFQCGALISDYPILTDVESTHGKKGMIGNNFACRLLSKFRLESIGAWSGEGFQPTAASVLYPNDKDSWFEPTQEIKTAISE
jgi:hypothetical protein